VPPSVTSPHSIDRVHLTVIGSAEFTKTFEGVAQVQRILPGSWHEYIHHAPIDCLVVDGNALLDAEWDWELTKILEDLEQLGIPRILWLATHQPGFDLAAYAHGFSRVFTRDSRHIPALQSAGCAFSPPLPAATTLPLDISAARDTGDRVFPIVWLGGWQHDWSPHWCSRVISILRAAAPWGLHIFGLPDRALLPIDLQRYCNDSPMQRGEILRNSQLVLAIDHQSDSRHVVPEVLFDAIASGAAIVSPHDYALRSVLRDLMPVVVDEQSTRLAIDHLRGDHVRREELVEQCIKILINNHTYTHRLATLLSSVGFALVPDAASDPAHS
jgi:Glycosyl transferases group 1